MLETASIAGGAVSALFLALVIGFFAYVRWHQGKKLEQLESLYIQSQTQTQIMNGEQQQVNGNGEGTSRGYVNASADVVDGVVNGDRCLCQNVQISNLSSNPVSNQTNGDNRNLKHPQASQFSVTQHVHHSHPHSHSHLHQPAPPHPKMRPFGPHHACSITMGDVILKR
jgi:hypothetical protein